MNTPTGRYVLEQAPDGTWGVRDSTAEPGSARQWAAFDIVGRDVAERIATNLDPRRHEFVTLSWMPRKGE